MAFGFGITLLFLSGCEFERKEYFHSILKAILAMYFLIAAVGNLAN